ncbi:MAG: hypothetical protein WDZ45_00435 [Flavobacteriaceae bacterium]
MKKYRLSIGVLSILIALLYLFFDVVPFILLHNYHEIICVAPVYLKTSISSWLVSSLLMFGGVLLLYKNRFSQDLYGLFGISIFIEVYTQIIYFHTETILIDYYLIPSLSLGVSSLLLGLFALLIVSSEKWKNRLGWDKKVSLKVWFIYLLVSFLISGLPRLILEYPAYYVNPY